MASDWIVDFIHQGGYLGVAALMFAENIFPPIPSEVVMPVAGLAASQGELALGAVIVAGTAGALAGQLFWYWLGYRIGDEGLKAFAARHGRWITMTPRDVDRADAWFDRHGAKAVLIGRMIPGVRTLISLPAGLSEMPVRRFLVYSTIGTTAWTAALASAGYTLGEQFEGVSSRVGPLSTGVLLGIASWYIYRLLTFTPRPR